MFKQLGDQVPESTCLVWFDQVDRGVNWQVGDLGGGDPRLTRRSATRGLKTNGNAAVSASQSGRQIELQPPKTKLSRRGCGVRSAVLTCSSLPGLNPIPS